MRFLAVLLTISLAAPLALAGPAPAIHYLADDGSPLQTGDLATATPSKNESSMRAVALSPDGPAVWFEAPAAEDRIAGPVFLGLWTQANLVLAGNLTASLWLDDGTERTQLASSSLDVTLDPSQAPDPMTLLPPDPTDPEGAAYHVAAQVLPLLMRPPIVFDMGVIDAQIPDNGTILLGLALENGELPALGTSIIQYDAMTTPSFLYVPWYAPDPPAPEPTNPAATSTAAPSSSESSSPSSTSDRPTSTGDSSGASPSSEADEPGEESPGIGLMALLVALGAAAYVARRR